MEVNLPERQVVAWIGEDTYRIWLTRAAKDDEHYDGWMVTSIEVYLSGDTIYGITVLDRPECTIQPAEDPI